MRISGYFKSCSMTPQKATNPETLWEAPNFQAMQCQHTPTIHQASTRCTNPKNHVNLRQKMTKMQIKVWSIEDVLQSQLQWGHCSWQSVGSLRAELCPTRLLMCQSQNRFRFGKQMQDPPNPYLALGSPLHEMVSYDFYTVHVQFEATLQESIHWILIHHFQFLYFVHIFVLFLRIKGRFLSCPSLGITGTEPIWPQGPA